MYNHEPKNYQCPFCRIVDGVEDEYVATNQEDVFYSDEDITAFVASHSWPNNNGHVLIIPNEHIENIYSLPNRLSHKIHDFEKLIAIALKKIYKCEAVSSRQHNEPDGNQDVWHYHLHVFPRYKNDRLYELNQKKQLVDEKIRKDYFLKLMKHFKAIKI